MAGDFTKKPLNKVIRLYAIIGNSARLACRSFTESLLPPMDEITIVIVVTVWRISEDHVRTAIRKNLEEGAAIHIPDCHRLILVVRLHPFLMSTLRPSKTG